MEQCSCGSMRDIIAIHQKIKDLQLIRSKKYFSPPEFFLMGKIYMLAEEKKCGEIVGVGVSMKKMSEELKVSPAMVTKTVTALEEKGCVSRVNDRNDRRGVNVCVTSKGYELWQEEFRLRSKAVCRVFERMGEEKTDMLIELADEFARLLEEESEKLIITDDKKG